MTLSNTARSALIAAALGAATAAAITEFVPPAWAQAASPTVTIGNFTFNPPSLTIKAGTTVVWTNRDDIPHGIASADNAFKRSQALDTDDSFSFVFTTPGTYRYFCYLHPNMTGTIVVTSATGDNAKP
jgi:plastocyanin